MRTKRMVQLSATTGFIVLLAGCALYTSTRFTEYRGPSEFEGNGGTVRTVDGIDVWQTGTPNRKFKVLGVIEQSHYDNHSLMSAIAGASKDSEIIKQVKTHGGDAVIILSSSSAITGFSTRGSQSGQLTGYGSSGYYSGSYSGSSSTYTHANTKTDKVIAVIKYLD